jgi:hypothetical protein
MQQKNALSGSSGKSETLPSHTPGKYPNSFIPKCVVTTLSATDNRNSELRNATETVIFELRIAMTVAEKRSVL